MSSDIAYENTDVELWREQPEGTPDSYYSPSIHRTDSGGIGINVGGMVYVKTLKEWHRLTEQEAIREKERAEQTELLTKLILSVNRSKYGK